MVFIGFGVCRFWMVFIGFGVCGNMFVRDSSIQVIFLVSPRGNLLLFKFFVLLKICLTAVYLIFVTSHGKFFWLLSIRGKVGISSKRWRLCRGQDAIGLQPMPCKVLNFWWIKLSLHFAAAKGHNEIVALLLENGADLNSRNYCAWKAGGEKWKSMSATVNVNFVTLSQDDLS